jgi:hypothetical protein
MAKGTTMKAKEKETVAKAKFTKGGKGMSGKTFSK